MVKKQTVWLLTMISLMIVLSVYYITSDKDDLAYINNEQEQFEATLQDGELPELANTEEIEMGDVTPLDASELFTTIRMELEDERNSKKDRLKEVVASSDATASDINQALEEINEIEQRTTKEKILQETILATNEKYADVLVRAEEEKVHVHVLTDDLTKTEAVEIMQMIRDELGNVTVDVNFQATSSS